MANFLKLDSVLESSLGLDEFGIGLLRSVQWSSKYLWSVRYLPERPTGSVLTDTSNEQLLALEDIAPEQVPPQPFDKFFPAVDIEISESELETRTEEGYGGPLEYPYNGGTHSAQITFLDDQDNTLYNFHRRWITNRILGKRRYTLPITECLKAIEVRKLKMASLADFATGLGQATGLADGSPSGTIADSDSYWIFPRDGIPFNGSSQSETHLYSMQFVIAGRLNDSANDSGLGNAAENIARSLGAGALTSGIGNVL